MECRHCLNPESIISFETCCKSCSKIDPKKITDEQFEILARHQVYKHPDLLKIRDEEEIIQDFYDHYKRKRKDNNASNRQEYFSKTTHGRIQK